MTIRVGEIDSAAAVIAIDLSRPGGSGIGPVVEPALANAPQQGVEVVLGDQKSIMLRCNRGFKG